MLARLKSVEPVVNRFRFYEIELEQSLLGDWHLIKRWGRMGVWMQTKRAPVSFDDGWAAMLDAVRDKQKRGYAQCVGSDWDVEASDLRISALKHHVSSRLAGGQGRWETADLLLSGRCVPANDVELSSENVVAFPARATANKPDAERDVTVLDTYLGELFFDDDCMFEVGRKLYSCGIATVRDFDTASIDELCFALGDIEAGARTRTFLAYQAANR